MKKLFALTTALSLVVPALAEEAKLVMISTASGIPEGADFSVKPMGYAYGIKLTFFLEDENLIAFDKESLEAEGGWKLGTWPKVSNDGDQASFTISKKGNFLKKLDKVKVNGSIKLISGIKSEKKSAKANTTSQVDIGDFKVKLKIKKGNRWGNGVEVEGDCKIIKNISVTNESGKKLKKGSWSGFNKKKTYNFQGIEENATVDIEYWTETEVKTFTFKKSK